MLLSCIYVYSNLHKKEKKTFVEIASTFSNLHMYNVYMYICYYHVYMYTQIYICIMYICIYVIIMYICILKSTYV